MSRIVKEDNPSCRRRYAGRIGRRGAWAGALLLIVLASVISANQAEGGPSGSFVVSVSDMTAEYQRVQVPLNRSVVVQTSMAISQVNIVAEHIADVQVISPTELLITGKSYGTTNIVLFGTGNEQYMLEVAIELDLAGLNDALRDIDPQSDVQARSVLGNIVLTGTVSGAERAQRMLGIAELFTPPGAAGAGPTVRNHIDVAGEQQVLLHCVVAEVNRSATRQLGVNGFLAGENVRDMFLVNQLGGINPINIGAAADALITQPIPFLTGSDGIPNSVTPTLTLGFPRAQMQLFIKAMSNNGLLHVLAEPNLVAISGETATFLAGGEFPIPVPQGNQQVTIDFREFGIQLEFTPEVRAHQQIRLRVAPKVSELDFSNAVQIEGYVVPALTSRSAETVVELGSGQTIAIAGLLSEEVRGLATRVPGIGDVPVIGALFRSVEFRRSLTELVIFVTPEIVAPMDPFQVPRPPGDDIILPSDLQLYTLGWLEVPRDKQIVDSISGTTASSTAPATLVPSEPGNLSVHGPWGHATTQDAQP